MDEVQALERLSAILAQPQFQAARLPLWRRWLASAWEWLLDWLVQLWAPAADAAAGQAAWIEVVALLASAAGVVAIAVVVARSIRVALVAHTRLRAPAAASRVHSDALWQQAQRLAAAGDLISASRALYLSALYALEERGALRVDDARTNREHAARLASSTTHLGALFGALVARYDRLRYGGYPVDDQTYASLQELVERTRAAPVEPASSRARPGGS